MGPTKPHPNPKLASSNLEAAARETTSRQSGTSTPGHWRSTPRTSGRAGLPGDRAAGARPPALSQRRPERARLSGVRAARGSPPPHYSEGRRDAQVSPWRSSTREHERTQTKTERATPGKTPQDPDGKRPLQKAAQHGGKKPDIHHSQVQVPMAARPTDAAEPRGPGHHHTISPCTFICAKLLASLH